MSNDSEMLARIDERTEQILSRMDDLDKAVFTGNGHPSLMARVEAIESQFAQFTAICSECRKIVYAPKVVENKDAVILAALDEKKTITVERWKFWAAVVSGLCGLVAAVLALLSQLH